LHPFTFCFKNGQTWTFTGAWLMSAMQPFQWCQSQPAQNIEMHRARKPMVRLNLISSLRKSVQVAKIMNMPTCHLSFTVGFS